MGRQTPNLRASRSPSKLRMADRHQAQPHAASRTIRECGDLFFTSPSPCGRGWREAPGEGSNAETLGIPALIRPFLDARPTGLALRAGHLLPEGEGLAPSVFAILDRCAPGG